MSFKSEGLYCSSEYLEKVITFLPSQGTPTNYCQHSSHSMVRDVVNVSGLELKLNVLTTILGLQKNTQSKPLLTRCFFVSQSECS